MEYEVKQMSKKDIGDSKESQSNFWITQEVWCQSSMKKTGKRAMLFHCQVVYPEECVQKRNVWER